MRLLFLVLLLSVCPSARAQSVVAVDDTLSVTPGGTVFDVNRVLLANDVFPEGDSVAVLVLATPQHGTLTPRSTPTEWVYRPDDGFLGEDGFTYQFRTVPRHVLTLDPASSSLTFDATLETALGTDSDSEVIPVNGLLRADFGSEPQTAAEIHIVGLDVQNAGPHSLRFEYGPSGAFGSLRIRVDSSHVNLRTSSTGPTTATSGPFRSFVQAGNTIQADVLARLEGTGLLAPEVPSDPQSLITETGMDLNGSVILGQDVAVLLYVDGSWNFDLSGTIVQLHIGGTLQARGPRREGQQSGEAVVRIHVGAGTDRESLPDRLLPELGIFPQPFTDVVRIEAGSDGRHTWQLEVFDILGRRVAFESMAAGAHEMGWQLDASKWSPGLYLVRVSSGRHMMVRPMIRQ